VRFGAFITSISDLDPDDGSFRMVGYIWTVDPAARFNPVGQIEVLARESKIQPIAQTVLPDGSLYVAASFDAIADHDFDVRAYPFERSVLGLQFEAVEDVTELVFVPDRRDSRIADFAVVPGWHIDGLELRSEIHRYDTGFGYRAELPSFSRVEVAVEVGRDRSPLILGKFTGFLVAFLITAIVYVVPPTELGARLGMTTSSVFAAVANRYRLEDAIGFDAAFGLVDRVTLLTFGAILLTLVVSLVSHHRLQQGADPAAVTSLDRRIGIALMAAILVLFSLAFRAALA
jgi:hypothetical protein